MLGYNSYRHSASATRLPFLVVPGVSHGSGPCPAMKKGWASGLFPVPTPWAPRVEAGAHRLSNRSRPGCRWNKYNFSARWLLPEAGSEMSVFIKCFTCNYISRGAQGGPGPPRVDASSFASLARWPHAGAAGRRGDL